MALGDYYQVIDLQKLQSQQVIDTYFYVKLAEVTGFATDAEALASAWVAEVRPSLLAVQNAALSHVGIRCYNLFDPADMYEADYSVPVLGTVAGDFLANFNAWGFKSPRTRRDIRAGMRRIGGLTETQTTGSVPTGAALTLLNTLAIKFGQLLDAGSPTVTDSFAPIIVKRVKVALPNGHVSYRLPVNSAEGEHVLATNWAFQQITTQNSRKVGNGA